MPFHLAPADVPAMLTSTSSRVCVTRRDFIASLAVGGAALSMSGCSRRAGSRGNEAGWHAWFSDPHIAADPSKEMHGQVLSANLRAVVADILDATDPPKSVLVNGDIALHDGQPADYRAFLSLADPLRKAGIDQHFALGNHDDRSNFHAVIKEGSTTPQGVADKYVSAVDAGSHRMLILDSLIKPNVTGGLLGDGQLAWLARQLDTNSKTPAVVFVHHNINAERASALHDTNALLDVLRPRRQAKAVVFGHTHVWNVQKIDGIHMINLPAVGYKFLSKQPLGWCLFRPRPDGAELELRCVGGDRHKDRQRVSLTWRSA